MNDKPIAFSKLNPLCVNFLRDCSVENIEKIKQTVQELDNESIDVLQEYIVFPFRARLLTKIPEKITIKCMDVLTCIFKKSRVKTWDFFADIFSLIISKISDGREMNKVVNTSEELKFSVCEVMSSLVQSSTEEVLNEMFSLSFRPNFALALYSFNILLSREKSKILLKAVLSTIGVLTYNGTFIVKRFEMTEKIASESLASCLPGLSIALQKIACGDIKQGHEIVMMALNVLTNLMILVVGDDSYKRGIVIDEHSEVYCFAYKSGKLGSPLSPSTTEQIPIVKKNKAWFKTVSEKLEVLIKNLTMLASHDHWKARLEFLKSAESVLLKCTTTLENCIPVLLPAVFSLSVDDNGAVSAYCADFLTSFSEHFKSTNSTSLNSIIENNIEKLTSQLIKYKLSTNDAKKLITLKSLYGYVKILYSSPDIFLFSISHTERIILTILSLLEFDISVLNLVEEVPVLENFDELSSNLTWPKKRFKFFENEEILSTVCKICYCLGQIQDCHLLVDYLLDKLSHNNLYTLQCVFVIGNLFKGLSSESNAAEKYAGLVAEILEMFLSSAMFDVQIQNTDNMLLMTGIEESSSDIVSNNVLSKNKLQICLLLEAIAKCSECLHTGFKEHLMKALCPVMEKAGSSNVIISQCGYLCLSVIAQSCKYISVKELIKDNADYLTNVLMINFHQYFHRSEVVIVLRVAMEQSDAEALILFRDLIFQILNILDYNQDKAHFLMNILFAVVLSIKKWFPSEKDSILDNSKLNKITYQNLKTSVLDYISVKKSLFDLEPENYSDEETKIESDTENINDSSQLHEKKPDIPLHIKITCEIFNRCVHLQSSENAYLRMLSLEMVELCILILRDYEDQLLPLVHEFWSPFLRRFTEDTFISKAFNVLLAIAKECGDFIRHRTFKDVIPKLVHFLEKEHSKSGLKCNFKHYQWTSDHSLQVLVLSEIGYLCTKLDIDDKDLNAVANVCLPYLEKEQPKALQDAALKSLKALETFDPDAIWYYWNVLYSEEKVLTPPCNSLLQLSFPHSNNTLTTAKIEI